MITTKKQRKYMKEYSSRPEVKRKRKIYMAKYGQKYYKINKERIRERKKKYYLKNKEKIDKRNRKWMEKK